MANGFVVGFEDAFVVVARDNQDVNGGLGQIIGESDAHGVFVQKRNGHFAPRDAPENGVSHEIKQFTPRSCARYLFSIQRGRRETQGADW